MITCPFLLLEELADLEGFLNATCMPTNPLVMMLFYFGVSYKKFRTPSHPSTRVTSDLVSSYCKLRVFLYWDCSRSKIYFTLD